MWKKIESNSSVMLEAQWIFRCDNKPAISLKRDKEAGEGTWIACLLNLSGISCVVHHTTATTLEQAQRNCEKELRLMGWTWGATETAPSDAATKSA